MVISIAVEHFPCLTNSRWHRILERPDSDW